MLLLGSPHQRRWRVVFLAQFVTLPSLPAGGRQHRCPCCSRRKTAACGDRLSSLFSLVLWAGFPGTAGVLDGFGVEGMPVGLQRGEEAESLQEYPLFSLAVSKRLLKQRWLIKVRGWRSQPTAVRCRTFLLILARCRGQRASVELRARTPGTRRLALVLPSRVTFGKVFNLFPLLFSQRYSGDNDRTHVTGLLGEMR